VARERLCLRGTTDYRINGLDGAPFFVLTQAVNPGLIAVLRQSIVPRLLAPDGVKGHGRSKGSDLNFQQFLDLFCSALQ